MDSFEVTVESLFDGQSFLTDQQVSVKRGRIAKISDSDVKAKLKGTLVAGFIDLQVNGGGNFLFNETPDLNTLRRIGQAHQAFGTTGWLPTLITDSIETMQQAADSVAQALAEKLPGVLGIHFEGPHLSVNKKGVHSSDFIREISDKELALFCRQDIGQVLLTVAPENVSVEVISTLVEQGVKVCLGHSNASFEQTEKALAAGADGFTHIYNAMSALQSREPGMVGAAMANTQAWCGLIVDGIHVHPGAMRALLNAKKKVFLVTDAMPPVGSNEKSFNLYGETMLRQGNQLSNSQGQLAGSVLNMAQAVTNCQSMLGCDLGKSLNMAALNPATYLGLEQELGSLAVGKRASMLLLDEQGKVQASWIDGIQVV